MQSWTHITVSQNHIFLYLLLYQLSFQSFKLIYVLEGNGEEEHIQYTDTWSSYLFSIAIIQMNSWTS